MSPLRAISGWQIRRINGRDTGAFFFYLTPSATLVGWDLYLVTGTWVIRVHVVERQIVQYL